MGSSELTVPHSAEGDADDKVRHRYGSTTEDCLHAQSLVLIRIGKSRRCT